VATPSLQFRIAQAVDFVHLAEVDERWTEPDRRLRLEQAILELRCWVAAPPGAPDRPVAYGLLRHNWFGQPLLELLMVHPQHRGHGIGSALLKHLVAAAGWPEAKVFASANRSNTIMRQLLEREGFIESGIIHNLDEGDPELIYVKLPGAA
jgi:GNAT superfamily N-acetyltransferase